MTSKRLSSTRQVALSSEKILSERYSGREDELKSLFSIILASYWIRVKTTNGISCLISLLSYSALPFALAEKWEDIETFSRTKESWFRKYLELPHVIPCHDTLARVFALLDPQQYKRCFLSWIQAINPRHEQEIINIDGKTLRRSYGEGKSAIHMVSAWANKAGLTLGQGEGRPFTAGIRSHFGQLAIYSLRGSTLSSAFVKHFMQAVVYSPDNLSTAPSAGFSIPRSVPRSPQGQGNLRFVQNAGITKEVSVCDASYNRVSSLSTPLISLILSLHTTIDSIGNYNFI